jgi:hypothetical protein
VSFTDDLGRELSAVGITGRLRERIVAEFADHLESDPQASLGEPAELARQFADEHGSIRARRAVLAGFAALALAALAVAVGLATGRSLAFPVHKHPHSATVATIGAVLTVIGGQVAFAAGVLAALRVLNRRGAVLNRAEAVVLGRRVAVALGSALVAMAGLAIVGIDYHHVVAGSWPTVALVGACVGAAGLLAATPWVLWALRLRPVQSGTPGDIFDDLGPLAPSPLVDRPWVLALIVAAAITVAITAGGVIQSDPFDGAARGILDGLACLAGFALLGRYLGLRAPAASD